MPYDLVTQFMFCKRRVDDTIGQCDRDEGLYSPVRLHRQGVNSLVNPCMQGIMDFLKSELRPSENLGSHRNCPQRDLKRVNEVHQEGPDHLNPIVTAKPGS